MKPRMQLCEQFIEKLEELIEDIADNGIRKKYIKRLEKILLTTTKDNAYSATTSAHILNDEHYLKLKEKLLETDDWNEHLQYLEKELKTIAFDFQ